MLCVLEQNFEDLTFPRKLSFRMNNVIAMETLERHQEATKATDMEGKIIKTKTQLLFSLCFKKALFNASKHKKTPGSKIYAFRPFMYMKGLKP